MKLKFLALLLSLVVIGLQANAKKPISANPAIDGLINIDEKTDNRESLTKFDFEQLFDSAENYFKKSKKRKKIKCKPINGILCTKHYCKPRKVESTLILDKEKELITRCEGDICESYKAEFKQTGVFFNVQSEGPIGSLIRVLGNSRYKEITTVGLDAYVANGNCDIYIEENK